MWPIVTGQVAWSVGRSVGLSVCHTIVRPAKTAEPIEMPFRLRTRSEGSVNHVLDGGQQLNIPHGKGHFWEGKGRPIVKCRDFLPRAVQKRLNRSRCCLGCGYRWADGNTSSFLFASWRQCARRHSAVSCAKMAVPIDILKKTCRFGLRLWTRVSRRKHKFNRIR